MANKNNFGRLHHVAIQTANFDRALRFYTEILGLKVVKEPFNYKGTRMMAWLDSGGTFIELYSVKIGKTPEPYNNCRLGADHIAFEVEDLDLTVRKIKENGFVIIKEPFLPPVNESNHPRIAFIEGPDMEELELREQQK